ncbi:Dabb family protein [Halovulum sp. GXIMD14794]
MLRHIVLLTFKPEADDDARDALRAAVARFPAQVPEVRSLTCGDNVGSGPNHHDFAVVADFDDMAAFSRYIESYAHRNYVETHAKTVVAKLSAIQHEF